MTLTGEGADEWLAGYPWYKVDRVLGCLDVIPGLELSQRLRRLFVRATGGPRFSPDFLRRVQDAVGGHNAWLDIYGMMSLSKLRFYSAPMLEALRDHIPHADLAPDLGRMRKWHPLHRALWLGIRAHLPGLLLNAKGDRVAMNSSVEARYPFLDEAVFDYLAPLHPRWKLRGLRDKYLLRRVAERWLPRSVARRHKVMFRAPFDSFHGDRAPAFVDQLLSAEALNKTGYFDAEAVRSWRQRFKAMRPGSVQRISVEMGLVGVLATQLWHQTFIDGGLADVPAVAKAPRAALAAV